MKPEQVQRAVELRAEGVSYNKIAKELGVSHGSVYYACNPLKMAGYRAGKKSIKAPEGFSVNFSGIQVNIIGGTVKGVELTDNSININI